jgi:hypothetical protein
MSRLSPFRLQKDNYVRNCLDSVARSDVAWVVPCLAPQPELGIWTNRRTGVGLGDSDRDALTGPYLREPGNVTTSRDVSNKRQTNGLSRDRNLDTDLKN